MPEQAVENRRPWINLEAIRLYDSPWKLCPTNTRARRAIAAYLTTRRISETRRRIRKLLGADPWISLDELQCRLHTACLRERLSAPSEWAAWWFQLNPDQRQGWTTRAYQAETAYRITTYRLDNGTLLRHHAA